MKRQRLPQNKRKQYAQLLLVTVAKAAQWLDNANDKNRSISEDLVLSFASEMELGRWVPGSVISFDWNGCLIDGQHRLRAVLLSEKPQEFLVVFNAQPNLRVVGADERPRSVHDALRMTGDFNGMTNGSLGVLRAMIRGIRSTLPQGRMSTNATADWYGKYALAVQFGVHSMPGYTKGITVAPVRAAAGRGYVAYRDKEVRSRIEYFFSALRSSVVEGQKDLTIVTLRKWLTDPRLQKNPEGRPIALAGEQYARTARCLIGWLDGERITRSYMPDSDPFPPLAKP